MLLRHVFAGKQARSLFVCGCEGWPGEQSMVQEYVVEGAQVQMVVIPQVVSRNERCRMSKPERDRPDLRGSEPKAYHLIDKARAPLQACLIYGLQLYK
jgi:hypothetical protein